MTVCRRVLYWGRVQGVGFRYTAQGLAQGFAVTGHVRNLPGGQVEVVVEGAGDEVDRFLAALAGSMADYIKDHRIQDEAPQGFAEFVIRP